MAKSNVPLMFLPLARYADFNGRSRRSEYWLWALFMFLLNIALSIVQFAMLGAVAGSTQDAAHAGAAMGPVMIVNLLKFVVFLGLLVPNVAVAVRRMHDINRTGWWIIFPSVVGLIAIIVVVSLNGADFIQQVSKLVAAQNSHDTRAFIAMFVSMMRILMWIALPTLAAKVVTFVFRVTEGTQGANRYGPDPKGAAPTNVF